MISTQDAVLWARICNLLDRLRIAGTSDMVVSYAHDAVSSWDLSLCIQPHHWGAFPQFAAFAPTITETVWLPLETLVQKSEKKYVSSALDAVQHRKKSLLLERKHVKKYIQYIRRAWGWCAEYQVDPAQLRLRVDPGTQQSKERQTSFLHTHHAFGVKIQRCADMTARSRRRATGPYFAFVALERDHPARDVLMMEKRKKTTLFLGFRSLHCVHLGVEYRVCLT